MYYIKGNIPEFLKEDSWIYYMYNGMYLSILLINLVAMSVKFYYIPCEPWLLTFQWTQLGDV